MISFELADRMCGIKTRRIVWSGPFVLRFLYQQCGLRKQLDIADVVRMAMGHGDVFDVAWLNAELIKLARKRLGSSPVRRSWIGRAFAIRHCCDCVSKTGIPEEPALRMVNQIAVVRELHRFADVNTWRPARDVASDTLSAI